MSSQKLFEPIKVGNVDLKHRIVLAPLTRYKSTKKEHVPIVSLMSKYYGQRSSRPGTLLITEATFIAAKAGGYDNIPGIWSKDQIDAWKQVTDAVHANGSFIYMQLWAIGRAAIPAILLEDGFEYVSSSAVPMNAKSGTPRELTVEEVQEYVQLYAQAAKNAVQGAGFDGVEIHGANGYLIDQFTQDTANHRTDQYGGSIENRSRFALEVADAVSRAVGEERTAIRLSPWSTFQGMRMEDPIPQFSYLVNKLKAAHPNFAYLHVVQPNVHGSETFYGAKTTDSNDFIRKIWAPKPLISAGGYSRDEALTLAEEHPNELFAFGKYYISNPDLPTRLYKNIPLTQPNRKTFYVMGDTEGAEVGYIDYPFAHEAVDGDEPSRL